MTRLVGGYLADRFRRRKAVAFVGYALSVVAKLGLPGAHGASAIGGVIALDRTGKGLRTAPRDALIAHAVPERGLVVLVLFVRELGCWPRARSGGSASWPRCWAW